MATGRVINGCMIGREIIPPHLYLGQLSPDCLQRTTLQQPQPNTMSYGNPAPASPASSSMASMASSAPSMSTSQAAQAAPSFTAAELHSYNIMLAHATCGALATMLFIPLGVLVPRLTRGLTTSRWWFPAHAAIVGLVAYGLVSAAWGLALMYFTDEMFMTTHEVGQADGVECLPDSPTSPPRRDVYHGRPLSRSV